VATSFRKFLEGLRIIPKAASTASEKGDLDVTDLSGKLNYHNGTSASPVVTEAHQATLTNKTLTSPVLNTPTADTITGIAGGSLVIQSASNEDLSLQAQGSGSVSLEALNVDGNTVTGGASTLTIQSDTDEDIIVQSQGTGDLILQAAGSGVVKAEDVSVSGNTVTGGASTLTIQSALNQDLSLQAQGSGVVQVEGIEFDSSTVSTASGSLTLSPADSLIIGSEAAYGIQTDSSTTGSNATIATPTKSYIELTNISLSSIDAIPAGIAGQVLVISNRTGNTVVVNNETGATSSNRILTGTNGAIALDNNASLTLLYNTSASRWMIVGGVGGNLVVNLTAGETLAPGEAVYVSQGALDGGRTAGRVYKLDPTNDDRIDFIGFALDSVSSGATLRVQVAGGLGGFSGLSTGLPVYASVTVPGGTQTSAPTAGGQWVIQLGTATSATALVINAAGGATAIQVAPYTGSVLNQRSISSSGSLTNDDDVILVDASSAAVSATLPTPLAGKFFHIKKVDYTANLVTVLPSSTETIDGTTQKSLVGQYDSIKVISDGTNWWII
jgi:hypothetical protein